MRRPNPRLRTAREHALGMTRAEFAAMVERESGEPCDERMIYRWEEEEVKPRPARLRAVVAITGLSAAQLGWSATREEENWSATSLLFGAEQDVGARCVADEVRRAAHHLVALDGKLGGNDVAGAAVRLYRQVQRRLGDRSDRDMLSAAAEVAEVAGWALYDADEQDRARSMTMEALHLAQLAGDAGMERFALANLAMQAAHLRRPGEGLAIARAALDSGPLTPRVRTLFIVRLARGLALAGRDQEARDAFAHARSQHNDGVGNADPSWTWWISERELCWHEAMLLADIGRQASAVDLFRAAVGKCPRRFVRARYNDLSHLLQAMVGVGAWRDAEPVIAEIAPYVGVVGSGRTEKLLRQTAVAMRRADTAANSTVRDGLDDLTGALDPVCGSRAGRLF
jgi:hypothetical protein